jgi:hypothetical protein
MVKRELKGFIIDAPGIERSKALAAQEETRRLISSLASSAGVSIIDPFSSMCSTIHCPALSPKGYPVSVEGSHTSPLAIVDVGGFIDGVVQVVDQKDSPPGTSATSTTAAEKNRKSL